jgi:hypothetical protein
MEHQLPQATALVFMRPGVSTCQSNCQARPWEAHKYASKEEQDANLPFLLDWARGYASRSDDLSVQAHRLLFDSYAGPKREVTANELDA